MKAKRITIRLPDGSLFEDSPHPAKAPSPADLTGCQDPAPAGGEKPALSNALIVQLRSPHGVETCQWLCPPCIERRKRARWEVLSQQQGPLLECDDCAGPGLEQGAPF